MVRPEQSDASRAGLLRNASMVVALVAVFAVAIVGGRWLRNGSASLPAAAGESSVTTYGRSQGRLLYATYCLKCHGPEGHGDPDAIERLTPPPRDFAGTNWRFPRTAESIERVIRDGIAGTAMPSSGSQFNDDDIAALREYVLHLADQPGEETRELAELDRWSVVGFTGFSSPRPAPTLIVERTDGADIELADVQGKVVLVNFWGTACVHCLREMPNLQTLAEELADEGFVVLSVCADESDVTVVAETANSIAPGFDVYVDATGLASQRYEVQSLPTFWLVDRNGQALARRTGAIDWSSPEIKSLIVELLSED